MIAKIKNHTSLTIKRSVQEWETKRIAPKALYTTPTLT